MSADARDDLRVGLHQADDRQPVRSNRAERHRILDLAVALHGYCWRYRRWLALKLVLKVGIIAAIAYW